MLGEVLLQTNKSHVYIQCFTPSVIVCILENIHIIYIYNPWELGEVVFAHVSKCVFCIHENANTAEERQRKGGELL